MRRVTHASAIADFTLDLRFDEESLRRFDMKPYLDFPVFQKLKSLDYFKDLNIEFGTVQWAGQQDISPDTLCLESIEVRSSVVV